jgi:hypothetical protein
VKYRTMIDPRADVTRKALAANVGSGDLGGAMRWALHLSDVEAAYLEFHNQDTLGLPEDSKQRDVEWRKFIEHPDSKPFRIGTRV